MDCPACEGELTCRDVGDVEIDVCLRCRGVWLDASELDSLIGTRQGQSVEARLDETAALPEVCRYCGVSNPPGQAECGDCGKSLGLACPRDGKAMYVVDALGVELDRCPGCKGLWVDGFERKKLGRLREQLLETAVDDDVTEEYRDLASRDEAALELFGVMVAAGTTTQAFGLVDSSHEADADESQTPVARDRKRNPRAPADAHSESSGPSSMRQYIEKYGKFSIDCQECGQNLTRYTAWEIDGEFFCIGCAEACQKVADTIVSAKDFKRTPEQYWHDESHLTEFLGWLVDTVVPWRKKGE